MNSLRIGLRLTIAFVTIIFLFLIGGGLGARQLQTVSQEANQVAQLDSQANAVLRVYNNSLLLNDLLYRFDGTTADQPLMEERVEFLGKELTDSIANAIVILAATPIDAQRNQAHLDSLESILFDLPARIDQFCMALVQGDEGALQTLQSDFSVTVDSISQVVERIDSEIAAERDSALDQMNRAQVQAGMTSVATAVLTTFAAILLGVLVVQSITRPLSQLDEAAQDWARGDMGSRTVVQGDDELAHLGRVFNEGAARLADLYANLESLVQERTAELERRATQLELSADLSQNITALLDVDSLLPESVALIQERFGCSYAAVFLYDGDRRELTLHAAVPKQPAMQLALSESNVIGWTAIHLEPTVADARTPVAGFTDTKHRLADTQVELTFPLTIRGELLGVLDLQFDQERKVSDADQSIFQIVATQIATALNNASVYEAEQRQRQFAEILQNIGRNLTSTLNISEVLDLFLEQVKMLVAYDRASILLWNGGELEIQAAVGFPDQVNPLQTKVPIESGNEDDVFVRIYRSKQPLIINRVSSYPRWYGVDGIVVPGSWLGVPLLRDNEVIGMLSLTHNEDDQYSERDAQAATAVGSHAAIALSNAQFYMRVKKFNEQLEYEVQNRTKALRSAYETLERLDSTKESFISIASHELRTPITVLKGYSQLLLKDPNLQENPYYTNLLEGMLKGVNRLHDIVDTMLDMAKIDGRTLRVFPEPMSVYILVREIVDELKDALDERQLTIRIEPGLLRLPGIEADQEGIKKVFYHIIINAIKYTPDGGTIVVDGWAWHSRMSRADWPEQGIEIVIRDSGIGINHADLDSIFHKFYQTGEVALHSSGKTKFKGGGSGLGLAIVKGIIEAHQGVVWAESEKHDENEMPGTEVHVVLPLNQKKNSLVLKLDELKF